jgi:hypothetical protein
MRAGRSLKEMGIEDPAASVLGGAHGQDPNVVATSPSNGPQIGSRPLGWRTGAPPRTILRASQVIPFAAVGKQAQGRAQQATQIVEADTASRSVVLTAPFVGFSIYVSGDSDVQPGNALRLPPGLPYEIPLVGHQGLYAVTDAPTYLTLNVQVAVYLIGDRERI